MRIYGYANSQFVDLHKICRLALYCMDFVSHGLWGGVGFGRKSRKDFWWAILIGMLPDVLSFGVHLAITVFQKVFLGVSPPGGDLRYHQVPQYVYNLYNFTHSLLIFVVVFGLVWLIRRKPLWVLGAWGLHILVDIPTHSFEFFPTPFLWPISDFKVNGIAWGAPIIFIPNVAFLVVAYGIWMWRKKHSALDNL